MIIPYCSVTTNKRNLHALSRYPWRFLLSTSMPNAVSLKRRNKDFANGYAIDNGAFADYSNQRPFQSEKFKRLIGIWGEGSDWVAVPDSIGNRNKTLEMADYWIDKIPFNKVLVVQDGMKTEDLDAFKSKIVGIFIGGTTDWKLKTIPYWSQWALENKKLCHVGRVNSVRRLKCCVEACATSFDGSGMARFVELAQRMTNALIVIDKQMTLFI